MLRFSQGTCVFPTPVIFFTLAGQTISEQILADLQKFLEASNAKQECRVFETSDDIATYFEGGVSPRAAVALFDATGEGFFTHLTRSRAKQQARFPFWSQGAQWGIALHKTLGERPTRFRGCAQQIKANFATKFDERLSRRMFPWGQARKTEPAPISLVLPRETKILIHQLQTTGPDLAASIAHTDHAKSLPTGSRISWLRVVPEAPSCETPRLDRAVQAMRQFEMACSRYIDHDPGIRDAILAGVDLGGDPTLAHAYLHPPVSHFSVARPDLHLTPHGLFASENDEMPGGFPELFHLDRVYNVNQKRWQQTLTWLFAEGPLLFLVSHEWSKPYLTEIRWLVETLSAEGYPAFFLSTDRLDELRMDAHGVRYQGHRIGTIWRQFPIFETRGRLVELVRLASEGVVRMVPEFAHFGNKVWFPIFHRHQDFFRDALSAEDFALLHILLPDSRLVRSALDFPARVGGVEIASLAHLRSLPEEMRNRIVLKVCGANNLAARSYGVLMSHGLRGEVWQGWIDQRIDTSTPFLIQARQSTSVLRVGVEHVGTGAPELFDCRVLLRPWVIDGELVSVSGCAVPSNTTRVHGRVDMAMFAVDLG